MNILTLILLIAAAYAIGSISPSYLLVRLLKGIDLRTIGSGNLGMTNALRALGAPLGLTVLPIDILKGILPALLFHRLLDQPTVELLRGALNCKLLFGVATIIGHCYPFYLGFRGGKGVLTALGAFIIIAPIPSAIAAIAGATAIAVTRYVSIGSILGGLGLAIGATVCYWSAGEYVFIAVTIIMALFIQYTHRTNIGRLLRGEEPKLWPKIKIPEAPSE